MDDYFKISKEFAEQYVVGGGWDNLAQYAKDSCIPEVTLRCMFFPEQDQQTDDIKMYRLDPKALTERGRVTMISNCNERFYTETLRSYADSTGALYVKCEDYEAAFT